MIASKVLILVEGQTEQTFVDKQLSPYLANKNIFLDKPIIVPTKKVIGGPYFKGGVTSYLQVKGVLLKLLNDTSATVITTMIDFYGLPKDFPGYEQISGNCYERVEFLERAFRSDINHPKFLPYLSLHEFEALLFTSPEEIAARFPDRDRAKELKEIRSQFSTPEEIDDGPTTSPSKRILKALPKYKKLLDGTAIIQSIGIDLIRQECNHFNEWLGKLESLPKQ